MSKFFSLLKIVKGQSRRDLEIFLSMSSNQLSELDQNIAGEILERIYQRKKVEDDFFFQKYFPITDANSLLKNRRQWNRTKNRLYYAFLRYFTMRLAEDHPLRGIMLLDFFDKNHLQKSRESLMKKERERLIQLVDSNDYIYQYLLSEVVVRSNKKQRKKDENFQLLEQQLDAFYLEKKLRCWCEKKNRMIIINRPFQESSSMVSWVEGSISETPSAKAKIYYYLYKMIGTVGEKNYQRVIDQLEISSAKIDSITLKECYAYLLNHCIRQVNKGITDFANEYLKGITFLENQNLLLAEDRLSPISFKNTINMGLIANKNKWVHGFFSRYKTNLAIAGHHGVLELSMASILFYEEKYRDCEDTLNRFDFRDPYHKLTYEHLKLKLDAGKVRRGKYDLLSFLSKLKNRKAFIRHQEWIEQERKDKLIAFLSILTKVVKQKSFDLKRLKSKVYILDWVWLERLSKE